jgi:hypothetical protein
LFLFSNVQFGAATQETVLMMEVATETMLVNPFLSPLFVCSKDVTKLDTWVGLLDTAVFFATETEL